MERGPDGKYPYAGPVDCAVQTFKNEVRLGGLLTIDNPIKGLARARGGGGGGGGGGPKRAGPKKTQDVMAVMDAASSALCHAARAILSSFVYVACRLSVACCNGAGSPQVLHRLPHLLRPVRHALKLETSLACTCPPRSERSSADSALPGPAGSRRT